MTSSISTACRVSLRLGRAGSMSGWKRSIFLLLRKTSSRSRRRREKMFDATCVSNFFLSVEYICLISILRARLHEAPIQPKPLLRRGKNKLYVYLSSVQNDMTGMRRMRFKRHTRKCQWTQRRAIFVCSSPDFLRQPNVGRKKKLKERFNRPTLAEYNMFHEQTSYSMLPSLDLNICRLIS